MTPVIGFALGTLALWIGVFLLILAAARLLRGLFLGRGVAAVASAAPWTVVGALLILVGGVFTRSEQPGIRIPLIWPVMPFWAWTAAFAAVFALIRAVQAAGEPNREGRRSKATSALVALLVAAFAFTLLRLDPAEKYELLRGAIGLTPTSLFLIVAIAFATIVLMASSARKAASAGWGKTAVSQVALLSGSILFGLPFAFLVITGFKEDRDMSSAEGIVWVPKVQQTRPYFDKKTPLYRGTFEGQQVEGVVIEELPDDTVRVDISKPYAIRGTTFVTERSKLTQIAREAPLVTAKVGDREITGFVAEDLEDGRKRVEVLEPASLAGTRHTFEPTLVEPIRKVGLRWQNYTEALSFLPPETSYGLVYLKNTLLLVLLSVIGTILSSSLAAYAFSRLKFPGRDAIFGVLLATLMLPAAVTLLPQFLIFKQLRWIDTLLPLWVPAFFGSAFNIFLLRQFFLGIPMELEDAARVDGCSYLRTFWSVMLPQIMPALAVVAIWTFMGAWNNFMGPLIYINSPETMPLSYALQLFQSDRGTGEPGMLMAFATLTIVPVLALFFFCQRYFIEGVTLSGLGGR